jgi:hypothetical protein
VIALHPRHLIGHPRAQICRDEFSIDDFGRHADPWACWSLSPFHGNDERLQLLDLTRFLHANRIPLRLKTL